MNAETFLNQFGHLADAPNGVQKLRELVLQLAVTGRLLGGEVQNEESQALLSAIDDSRSKAITEGSAAALPAELLSEAEDSTLRPERAWTVVTLGRLLSKMGAGSTPLGGKKVYVDDGVMFLRSQNVWNHALVLDDVARIAPEVHARMRGTHVRPSDVLLNITGASIGRSALVPPSFETEANVSQHVAILRPLLPQIAPFLHLCVISPYFQKRIMDVQVGVSREGLSMTRLRHFPVPLPPLAEQHRIVAKVDELLALCDELEDLLRKREFTRDRLLSAAIAALLKSSMS